MVAICQPEGDIDAYSVDYFRSLVYTAIDEACEPIVVVDFSDVNFICASAFRVLDECGTYAMRRDRSLVVAYLPAPYARIATLFQWNGAGPPDDYAVVTSIYQDA